jgi:c-di-GMP-binding flagellar brake protein YcgR
MAQGTQERRNLVRRKSDRELYELIEKKTGVRPEQLVRERKLRRAIRHTCKAVIDIDVKHSVGETGHWESDQHEVKARVLDLSEGGASLFCKHDLRQGTKCRVAIKLYDGSSVEAASEIRWASPKPQKGGFALGMQFNQMDDKNRKRLSTFLTELDNTVGLGGEE